MTDQVAAIAAELTGLTGYIQSRADAGGTADPGITMKLCQGIAAKVMHVDGQFSPAHAATITNAIPTAVLSRQCIDVLISACDARVASAGGALNGTVKGPTQICGTPWNYGTQSDVDVVNSKTTSVTCKIDVIVKRLHQCGLLNPHEQTYKWVLAWVLAAHFDTFPRYAEVYAMLQDVKQAFDSVDPHAAAALMRLRNFPDHPKDMPAAMYNIVYADAPPVAQEPPRVRMIGNHHIPMRKNSKLLSAEKPSGQAGHHNGMLALQDSSAQPQPPMNGMPPGMQAMMHMMCSLMNGNNRNAGDNSHDESRTHVVHRMFSDLVGKRGH